MLNIDPKCIHCGRCAEACPGNVIKMEEGTPVIWTKGCIRCGHCEAICPVGALYLEGIPHEEVPSLPVDQPVLDPETAALFLRARRSIRCFKDEIVPREKTEQLLNIARYAQTGSNSQGVSYLVLEDRTKRDKLHALLTEYMDSLKEPRLKEAVAFRKQLNEVDWLLRGAPMCIFALTDRNNGYTIVNPKTTLTYIELYAPTLELGTCWAGYLQRYAATDDPRLRELLELPEDKIVSGALLYGIPKYRYRRLVSSRDPIDIYWR